jgi:RNA polymerase sigma factor (sigma-70 family)
MAQLKQNQPLVKVQALSLLSLSDMYKPIDANDNIYDEKIAELFPLVRSLAKKYSSNSHDIDDLVQEGIIGVIKAVDNFDETKATKFSTYAVFWIKKYILDYLNRHYSAIHSDYYETLDSVTEDSDIEIEDQSKISLNFPANFPEQEKQIIIELYEYEFTLKQVALNLDISRERARQLKEKALRRLKAAGFTIE